MYIAKRAFDLIFSILLVIVLLPLFLVIGILINATSHGPVIFKQKRLGKNGRIFTIYKFRTMVENAIDIGTGLFVSENDFRITGIGNFLRKTSLDELPQLFNIIKGEMSFVGPRPPVLYFPRKYEEYNEKQRLRFTVLPGVTGYAQVNGRNELSWDEKIKFDLMYVENFSLLLDIKILVLTIYKVNRRVGIYGNTNGLNRSLGIENEDNSG